MRLFLFWELDILMRGAIIMPRKTNEEKLTELNASTEEQIAEVKSKIAKALKSLEEDSTISVEEKQRLAKVWLQSEARQLATIRYAHEQKAEKIKRSIERQSAREKAKSELEKKLMTDSSFSRDEIIAELNTWVYPNKLGVEMRGMGYITVVDVTAWADCKRTMAYSKVQRLVEQGALIRKCKGQYLLTAAMIKLLIENPFVTAEEAVLKRQEAKEELALARSDSLEHARWAHYNPEKFVRDFSKLEIELRNNKLEKRRKAYKERNK